MPAITAEEKIQCETNNIDQKEAAKSKLCNLKSAETLMMKFSKGLVVMKCNPLIKELQTIIRDKQTSRTDFIFQSDRLIRLVLEEGLNQLPFDEYTVTTHTGEQYKGSSFQKGICGVSIIRSGEAMEKGLRECCRSIRIGKILMTLDEESETRKVIYARFPPDIDQRKVMLMYPLLKSGGNVILGVSTLLDYGVLEENIYILSLFATPPSIDKLFTAYPNIRLLTTEVRDNVPLHFGDKYFGTE